MLEITRLQTRERELQQQVQHASVAAQGAQSEAERLRRAAQEAAHRSSLGAGIRLPPITPFRGNKSNTVNAFLRDIERQCDYPAHAASFPADQPHLRVDLAVAHLQEGAADWWESLSEDTKQSARGSWERFCETMRSRFQPVQAATLARARLRALRQRGNTVGRYTEEFLRELAPIRSEMHPNDQIFFFKEGLTDHRIHDKIVEGRPATLEETIDLAVQWEAQYARGRYPPAAPFRSASHSSFPSNSSGSVAMELSAIADVDAEEESASSPSVVPSASVPSRVEHLLLAQLEAMQKRLESIERGQSESSGSNRIAALAKSRVPNRSKDEVARLMREGRCLNCCEKGHMKRECSKQWQPIPKNM